MDLLTLPLALAHQVDEVCDRFEAEWRSGSPPRIESFLCCLPEIARPVLLEALLRIELEFRHDRGDQPRAEDYLKRFDGYGDVIRKLLGFEPRQVAPSEIPTPEEPGTGHGVDAGRDLLFGLLALQHNFIDRAALLAAFNEWIADKSNSLGQYLLRQNALTLQRHALLEGLVRELLDLHGGDPDKSLRALQPIGALREELNDLRDPHLAESLLHIAPGETEKDSTGTVSLLGPSQTGDRRYRVIRHHASGGLGSVSVARDQELRRDVALKELLPGLADHAESRARLIQEAEITAVLEHPGIVPVYSLGFDAQGRPFYTMRFIEGKRFTDAIKVFHETHSDPRRKVADEALAFRGLLRQFVSVCEAVAYAHSRGVIHRDLKPGNVILGKFGETLVIDWGLAKLVGRRDLASEFDGASLHASQIDAADPTQQGSLVGTPGYMSPEQASGRIDDLDARSDVYSLGATLYQVLTNRAPFEGETREERLKCNQEGHFSLPTAVNPRVPRALESVCLKAMEAKPEERYATVRSLAEDVERWMADEPLSVGREPLIARLGRWGRKNRLKVVVAMTLLLASVVALSVGIVLIEREREHTAQEQRRTKEALTRAQDNYRLATETVDRYFTQVSEGTLQYKPRMDRLRAELLASARDFYSRIAERNSGIPTARDELGRAYLRLAYIAQHLEREAEPIKYGEQALAIFDGLVRGNPTSATYRDDMAESLELLGELYCWSGKLSLSTSLFGKAVTIRERRLREHPGEDSARSSLANCLYQLSETQRASGQVAESEASLGRSREILEDLLRKSPDNDTYQETMAYTLGSLGSLYAEKHPGVKENRFFEQAIERWEALVREYPGSFAYQNELALAHAAMGRSHQSAGRLLAAAAHDLKALAIWKFLVRDHPDAFPDGGVNAEGVENGMNEMTSLSKSLLGEGVRCHDARLLREAENYYKCTIEILRRMIDFRPEELEYQAMLADATDGLGQLYRVTDRPDEAVRHHESALAAQERLARQHPMDSSSLFTLAGANNGLGLALLAAGQFEEAETAFRQAQKRIDLALCQRPGDAELEKWSGGVASNLGLALGRRGEYQRALDYLDRAIQILGPSNAKGTSEAGDWLSEAYHRRAEILAHLNRHREAIRDCDASMSLGQGRSLEVTRDETRLVRALSLSHSERIVEAVGVADSISKNGHLRGRDHYLLACIYSVASTSVTGEVGSRVKDPRQFRSRCLSRALDHLERAERAGCFRTLAGSSMLRVSPDLDPLRESSIYRVILMDEMFPVDPFNW